MVKGYSVYGIKIAWMHYYFIWPTWNSKPILKEDIKERCRVLLEREIRRLDCEVRLITFYENKIFLATRSNPKLSPHKIISRLKSVTSKILRKEFPELLKVPSLWTRSYFASTYGHTPKKEMKEYDKYLESQKKVYKRKVKEWNNND